MTSGQTDADEPFPSDAAALRKVAESAIRDGRVERAFQAYQRLIGAGAGKPRDFQELGLLHAGRGELESAVEQFKKALALDPNYVPAHCNLGLVLEDLGRPAEAVESLQSAIRLSANQPIVSYHLAAMGGASAPPICPPEYLVQLFDGYAARFEQHLVGRLGYRGPQLLLEAVRGLLPGNPIDVIDLGCGTGLCGRLFRSLARKMVGVDLSQVMVEQARRTGVYNELVRADIVTAMRDRPSSADLILAADVFIYVGDLVPSFHAAHTALRPGGWFAFTLEATDKGEYVLERTRRYAHSLDYVRRVARESGFVERGSSTAVLRGGEEGNVIGNIVVLSRP